MVDSVIGGASVVDSVVGGAAVVDSVVGGASVVDSVVGGASVVASVVGGASVVASVVGGASVVVGVGSGRQMLHDEYCSVSPHSPVVTTSGSTVPRQLFTVRVVIRQVSDGSIWPLLFESPVKQANFSTRIQG